MALEVHQIQNYADDGFLLWPDAIDIETVERARQVLIRKVGNAKENPYHARIRDSAVSRCFNEAVSDVGAALAGVRKRLTPPRAVYTVTVFPTVKAWNWPPPHIDHAKEEDKHLS